MVKGLTCKTWLEAYAGSNQARLLMRKPTGQDTSFYESLSDIAMATLGIFVIFFVISLLFVNRDLIGAVARSRELSKAIEQSQLELRDLKEDAIRQILNSKEKYEREIAKIQAEIDAVKWQVNGFENKIKQAEAQIKTELNLNADELIPLEEIRKILRQVKLKRKKMENEVKDIRMQMNNVRQEFSRYVGIENSHPYLRLGFDGRFVTLNGESVSEKNFRAILKEINAGGEFRFRMKSGIKAPEWLNDMLIEEGWPPIINFKKWELNPYSL